MVFNGGSEILFLRFKKTPKHVSWDGLVGKLQPWVNDLINVLILNNVKINSVKIIFSCSVLITSNYR